MLIFLLCSVHVCSVPSASNSKEVNACELPKADKLASATQNGPASGSPVASIKKEIVDLKESKRIDTREDDWGKESYETLQVWYQLPEGATYLEPFCPLF